ncbi:hypothetical protein THOG11_180100 [Vibrio harveyi]|nr:hypothetical protein THOD03_210100 [Vibrio harveyi]CAH1560019.1 hypothetical protein THOG11_180100 [Vibrio harveyi]
MFANTVGSSPELKHGARSVHSRASVEVDSIKVELMTLPPMLSVFILIFVKCYIITILLNKSV